jgi:hypothetical protein
MVAGHDGHRTLNGLLITGFLVHQVDSGWLSGAAEYFGWVGGAKRENTRCGLRPMSDKAARQKTRSPPRRIAMKMGRRPRCSSVTYPLRYAPSSRLADGPF